MLAYNVFPQLVHEHAEVSVDIADLTLMTEPVSQLPLLNTPFCHLSFELNEKRIERVIFSLLLLLPFFLSLNEKRIERNTFGDQFLCKM